jgi:uncharacterized protein (DUF1501 family)
MEPLDSATRTTAPPAPTGGAPTRAPGVSSRRSFLKTAGLVGGAGTVLGLGGFGLSRLLSWRRDPILGQREPLPVNQSPDSRTGGLVLVTLFLGGGNDGLRTVIPGGDGRYHDVRPQLSKAADGALIIDQGLSLHPKLAKLKTLYDQKRLAIVENVGYDRPNLSHFASTDIWMTCDTRGTTTSGWIGRWLDATDSRGHDPLRALAIGPQVPRYMRGDRTSAAAVQGTTSQRIPLLDGASGTTFAALAGITDAYHELADVQSNARDLLAVRSSLAQHPVAAATRAQGSAGNGANGARGNGGGPLASQLNDIASLIRTGLPTRVYGAFLGGFDTHAREEGTHDTLMAALDAGISGFFDALSGSPYANQVVLVTFSEFGRRVAENGSGGTDHGAGSVLFVAGAPVKSGVHGGTPDLKDLDSNGDIKAGVDFRSVFTEVTEKVLGADPAEVVGKGFQPVGFLQ